MKKSTKAALLSAFILPSVGHIFLKRYIMATALIGVVLTALCILIVHAVDRAQKITDKILSGEIRPDVTTITHLISKQPVGGEAELIEFATIAMVVVWLIGIADSFRVGRLQDIAVTNG